MQVVVRDQFTMIAAPVQCDVDRVPEGSHYVLLKRANAMPLSRYHQIKSYIAKISPSAQAAG
jgi:hypothetical protein